MNILDMIKSRDLVFQYKRYNEETDKNESYTALNNINVSIKKGEFVAILGHNGSGKSTLAKHMNAILIPTEGTVWVNGYDSKSAEDVWNIRQSAGMVFQNPDNQIVATIVEEDVAFGPENLGVAPEEIRRRVDESLATVGMTDYAEVSPHYLSGGQKQRVAIAGILAMRPSCIVLDEPTAMLDPIGRREVIDTVLKLNREAGITIILITHYMEEAVLADRVVVMEKGQVVMDGVPKEIFRQVEKMKAIGLDVPQVTEVSHILREHGISIPDDILSIDEMVGAICQLK